MSSPERPTRLHDRREVTLFVDYEGAADFVGDLTENLSAGGTFILTSREFELGSTLRLVLSFPGLLEPVTLEAVVRWARRDGEPGVGVEFLEGPGREKLAALVDRVQQGAPGTVARIINMLIVEDNEHVSTLVREGLESAARRTYRDALQFSFVTASTGEDALRHLAAGAFDAMLIDVYLPAMHGHQVIARVRGELGLVDLPVIAVSGGGDSARTVALGAGASTFLAKPMRLRQLLETLRQLIDLEI